MSVLTKLKPGTRAHMGTVFGSVALPWAEPLQFECAHGVTLGEIIEQLFAARMVDDGWRGWLQVYIDDVEIAPKLWRVVRPRPGRLVAVRARPGWNFVIQAAIQVAIAVAASVLVNAFVGAPPEPITIDPVRDIDASRNEIAPYRKVPAGFGKWRMFPPHAAKAYTRGDGEKVFLHMLFSWGVAPYALDEASLKLGDTPITEFDGVQVQHKLKPGDPWPTLMPGSGDEQEGPGLMDFAAGWVQRTTDASDADELQVELLFPQGLFFRSGDGDIKPFGVTFRIRYRAEGSSTWLDYLTGAEASEGHEYVLSGYAKLKPFRLTYKRAVTPGTKYEIAVKRVSVDDPGPKGHNAFNWNKLRTFNFSPPVQDDNLALTAVVIEAGDQLNGVIDLFNGVVTRIAPLWDAEEEEFGAPGATRNPAELVRWIATCPGNPKPRDPLTEIDNEKFGVWAELCAARGWKCDFELRAGGGLDELMETVARCGRGSLVQRNGKLSVVIDDLQPAPSQMFSPRNSWGFRSQRRYPAPTHALRCAFNNEEKDFVRDEMMVFYPGYTEETAELIRAVNMIGVVEPEKVYAAARRIIAEELVRPEDYVWRCDWENLICQRGQRMALSHYVIAVGRRSALVKALTLNEAQTHVLALTLDEEVTQTPGDVYGLKWRRVSDADVTVEAVALTNMGNGVGRVVTLATAGEGGTPIASAPKIGDLVTFGDASIETLDVVVQNINRANDLEAEIMALPYAEALFDGDSEEMPEWNSNVSGEAFPRPPAPVVQGVSAELEGIFVAYDFPLSTAGRVQAVEMWMKRAIDEDEGAAFEYVGTLPASARLAAFPPGEAGKPYSLKLVTLGSAAQRTLRTASDVIGVTSAGGAVMLSGWLTNEAHTVATAADGSGGDYGDAGGSFKLFRGGVDISDGTDPDDIATAYEVVSADAGLSIAIDAATGVYTVSALTVDNATAVLRATNGPQAIDRQYSIAKSKAGSNGADGDPGAPGADGDDGADAQTIRLTATSQQFLFNAENQAEPASQSITLSVNRQNIASGAVSWSASPSVTLTGAGDTRALAIADFGANTQVEITATLGSLSDKITIVRTRAGGNLFTTVRSSNVTLNGRSLRKASGSAAWDAQAYSVESFVGGAFCSARPAQTNLALMFGLNGDPTTDANYTSLDYAWYLRADAKLEARVNGATVWDNGGAPESYTTSTVLSIVYDGSALRFFKDGELKHAVNVTATQLRLFFDSSFHTVGAQINDVAFGPSGGAATKIETRYTRSVAPPSTPTGAEPAGWTVEIPAGNELALYTSTAYKTNSGALISVWSAPKLLQGGRRGDYVAAATYYLEDEVRFNGGTYKLRVASSTGIVPSGTADANAYWEVVSAPGTPGEPGTPPSGFTATIDLSSSSTGANLRTIADAAGYTGLSDATITFEVESGVNITGIAGGGIGIDSGTWPVSSYAIAITLTIKSGGIVRGGGGEGGSGDAGYGNAGGDAIHCRLPMTVNINSGATVQGGGGGGGGGGVYGYDNGQVEP